MTHHLKFCIVNAENGDIIKNDEIKQAFLNELCNKTLIRKMIFRGNEMELMVYWKTIQSPITNSHRYFVADCSTTPILSDEALYEITTKLLMEITDKIKLQFPIPEDWFIDYYMYKSLNLNLNIT